MCAVSSIVLLFLLLGSCTNFVLNQTINKIELLFELKFVTVFSGHKKTDVQFFNVRYSYGDCIYPLIPRGDPFGNPVAADDAVL